MYKICINKFNKKGASFLNKISKSNFTTKDLTLYGLFIALVYVATRFINIPAPTPGGLFHLGNVMAFTIAIVFGRRAGAISGAFGMALFDLTSPYAVWAPFTFIIRFAMGYIIGLIANKAANDKIKTIFYSLIGILISTVIMIVGYYITEVILYGNIYVPLQSVYGNFMQCVIGTLFGLPLSISLKAALKNRKFITNM
jgi:uncharacterized membrane protein